MCTWIGCEDLNLGNGDEGRERLEAGTANLLHQCYAIYINITIIIIIIHIIHIHIILSSKDGTLRELEKELVCRAWKG